MSKKFLIGCGLVLITFMLSSCTSSGVTTRAYVTDKQREDQNMEGNFGYLYGTPQPENRGQYRKTRKIYVLEVTKEPEELKELEELPIPKRRETPSSQWEPAEPVTGAEPYKSQPIVIPSFEDDDLTRGQQKGETLFEEYTVQEGDTLQKISKKYYDSYSQWTKIYDINKEIIKDPNRIKPGIILKIPMEEGENLK